MAVATTFRSYSSASAASGTSPSSIDLAAPSGVQEGDLLIWAVLFYGINSYTEPSGWAKVASTIIGTNVRLSILYRKAPASLGTSTIDTWSGTLTSFTSMLLAFQDARADWDYPGVPGSLLTYVEAAWQTTGDTSFPSMAYDNDVCVSANAIDLAFLAWEDGLAIVNSVDGYTEVDTVASGLSSSDVGLTAAYKANPTLDKPTAESPTISSDVNRCFARFIIYPARQDDAYENTVLGFNPQFYWPCDGTYCEEVNGGTNNAISSANSNRDATAADPIIPNTTQHSIDFDDTTANDMFPENDAGINAGTGYSGAFRAISGWFYTTDTTSNDMPIWKQGGASNGLSVSVDAGVLRAVAIEGSVVTGYCSYTISASTLYHFLFVIDSADTSTGLKLYVNGSLVDTQSHTISGGDLAPGSGGIAIGSSNGAWKTWDGGSTSTPYFKGIIQSIAYWNTDSETWATVANDIYYAGVGGGATTLGRLINNPLVNSPLINGGGVA